MVDLLIDPFLEQFWVHSDIARKVRTWPTCPPPLHSSRDQHRGVPSVVPEGLGSQAGGCEVGVSACPPTLLSGPLCLRKDLVPDGERELRPPTCTRGGASILNDKDRIQGQQGLMLWFMFCEQRTPGQTLPIEYHRVGSWGLDSTRRRWDLCSQHRAGTSSGMCTQTPSPRGGS